MFDCAEATSCLRMVTLPAATPGASRLRDIHLPTRVTRRSSLMSVFFDQAVMLLGWISAVAGAIAYCMASRGIWDAKSVRFQVTNMSAAGLMIIVGAVNGIWPSVAANMVWVIIGINTLLMVFQGRRAARRAAATAAVQASLEDPFVSIDDPSNSAYTYTFSDTLADALTTPANVHGDAAGEFVLEQTPEPADVLLVA